MSKLWTLYNIYNVPKSFFDRFYLPKRFVVFEDSEKVYSGIISFCMFFQASSVSGLVCRKRTVSDVLVFCD